MITKPALWRECQHSANRLAKIKRNLLSIEEEDLKASAKAHRGIIAKAIDDLQDIADKLRNGMTLEVALQRIGEIRGFCKAAKNYSVRLKQSKDHQNGLRKGADIVLNELRDLTIRARY